jgi:hypothetical protein
MPYSYLKGKKNSCKEKNKLIKTQGVVTTPLVARGLNEHTRCSWCRMASGKPGIASNKRAGGWAVDFINERRRVSKLIP